jgi:hypothetical protein
MHYQEYLRLQGQTAALLTRPLFFVCGAPKSGTTWLQRLIDAHPEALCGGEGHFFDRLWDGLNQTVQFYNTQQETVARLVYEGKPYYRGLQSSPVRHAFYGLVASVMMQRALPPSVRTVGDKTPRYTLFLDRLWSVFPEAKVVHLIRDGRDVVVSSLYHEQRSTGRAVVERSSADLCEAVGRYAQVWQHNIASARASAASRPATAGYHELRYEALHQAPEDTLGTLFGFLGVSSEPALVQRCLDACAFERLAGRRRGQVDAQAFHRQGVVGGWREQLSPPQQQALADAAGTLLDELGYGDCR